MRKILVVDDVPDTILLLGKALSGEFTILVSTSGAHALEILQRQTPNLMLLDIQMPGMDGYEVLMRMHEQGSTAVPVIMMTADDTQETAEYARQSGAMDVLVKPLDVQDLQARLRCFFAGLTDA